MKFKWNGVFFCSLSFPLLLLVSFFPLIYLPRSCLLSLNHFSSLQLSLSLFCVSGCWCWSDAYVLGASTATFKSMSSHCDNTGQQGQRAQAWACPRMHQLFRLVLGQRDLSRAGDLFSLDDSEIEDCLSQALEEIKVISCSPVSVHWPQNSRCMTTFLNEFLIIFSPEVHVECYSCFFVPNISIFLVSS